MSFLCTYLAWASFKSIHKIGYKMVPSNSKCLDTPIQVNLDKWSFNRIKKYLTCGFLSGVELFSARWTGHSSLGNTQCFHSYQSPTYYCQRLQQLKTVTKTNFNKTYCSIYILTDIYWQIMFIKLYLVR